MAQLVDWVILMFFVGLAAATSRDVAEILPLFYIPIFWGYHTYAWTSKRQATLGMRLAGIFVTSLKGQRLGWLRATGRFFARLLSYYTLGIGFLMHFFNDKRQTLHDRISGTVVLRRPSRPKS